MEDKPVVVKKWRRFSRLKIEKGTIRRRARKLENATVKHAHRFLTRRWANVRDVGRNTIAWLVAVGLLVTLAGLQITWFANAYTTTAPGSGGTYAEGLVGRLETMNPLFASTVAEQSAARLIFSSLLDYDRDNQLRPDVADSWQVSNDGKIYSVKLRKDVFWHDGTPLTASDVVFTVRLMQNETVRAQQYASWVGVKAEEIGDSEVKFTLPSVYAPFIQSLTFGILPKHLLEQVRPADLRENDFGRKPVGTGPFVFQRIQLIDPDHDRLVVYLDTNRTYYRGAPLLNHFQIHTYETRDALERALVTNEVTAAVGLGADQVQRVEKRKTFVASTSTISNGMFALFNSDSPLLKDVAVRQALVQGTNRQALLEKIHGRGVTLDGPLPVGFVPNGTARQASYNATEAANKLEAAGWKLADGVRKKDGKTLEVNLVAPKNSDYQLLVDEVTKQWKALGVVVKSQLADSDTVVSDYLRPRNYDVLMYELAIGADADVYSYWHSSQVKANGLNLANYRSALADDALSSARARLDPTLRTAKHKTFYEQWLKDVPAVALYEPLFSYVANTSSTSLEPGEPVAEPTARFRSVERWSVSQVPVMTTP